MRFLSKSDCQNWCDRRKLAKLDASGFPIQPNRERLYAHGPIDSDYHFCRQLEQALQPREACLLWVTAWDIWKSSENFHLYYRLRASYGDLLLLEEAPGHLFLGFESADLISFLQVGILCGWDMHLLPIVGYARAFVSHDEFVDFAADEANDAITREYAATLGGAELRSNEIPV
jgi:hypothetical protein